MQQDTAYTDVTEPFLKMFSYPQTSHHRQILQSGTECNKKTHKTLIYLRKMLASRMSHSFCFQVISCITWQQRTAPFYHQVLCYLSRNVLSPLSLAGPAVSGCYAAGPAGSTAQLSLASHVRHDFRTKHSDKNMGFVM